MAKAVFGVAKSESLAISIADNCTKFGPVFEMQNSIARSFVEISAKTARHFWQLE
jgi:hypothetical protein